MFVHAGIPNGPIWTGLTFLLTLVSSGAKPTETKINSPKTASRCAEQAAKHLTSAVHTEIRSGDETPRKSLVPKAVKAAGSLCLLVWLLGHIDIRGVIDVLKVAQVPYLLLAAAIGPISILLLSLRLYLLLRFSSLRTPYFFVLKLTWSGQFVNLFLPGSTGGDLFKILALCRLSPSNKTKAAAVIVADRVFALVGLLLFAIVGFFTAPLPWSSWLSRDITVSPLAGIAAGCVVTASALAFGLAFRNARFAKLFGHAKSTIKQVAGYFTGTRTTWVQIGAALAVQFVNFVALFLIARALGIPLSFVQVAGFIPILLLVLLLPITVNGHGLREFILITYFQWLGIAEDHGPGPRELAIAFSIGFIAYDLWNAAPGGVCLLFQEQHKRKQISQNDGPT